MMQTPVSSRACTRTFTDRHIHGIAAVDFATSPVAQIREALALLARRRTTGVVTSLPSLHKADLDDALSRLGHLYAQRLVTGVHLEGPFIAADYAGAHPTSVLHTPASAAGQRVFDTIMEHQSASSLVTMMTVAPELPGFAALVPRLVAHGIEPALGHTGATYAQLHEAIDLVTAHTGRPAVITHLYNAMRGFHHRDPGPPLAVAEAAADGRVTVELIADGHHVDHRLIVWWFRNYPDAVRLVSDASAATSIPEVSDIGSGPARLGHQVLHTQPQLGPRLANGQTIASGSKDLLTIHNDLVAAGIDHELVCAAMR